MSQPYSSYSHLRQCFPGVCFPKPFPWRLMPDKEALAGEINGIYRIRGLAIATNGVLVALLSEHGTIQFGHLAWFTPDKTPITPRVIKEARTAEFQQRCLEEYV